MLRVRICSAGPGAAGGGCSPGGWAGVGRGTWGHRGWESPRQQVGSSAPPGLHLLRLSRGRSLQWEGRGERGRATSSTDKSVPNLRPCHEGLVFHKTIPAVNWVLMCDASPAREPSGSLRLGSPGPTTPSPLATFPQTLLSPRLCLGPAMCPHSSGELLRPGWPKQRPPDVPQLGNAPLPLLLGVGVQELRKRLPRTFTGTHVVVYGTGGPTAHPRCPCPCGVPVAPRLPLPTPA